MMKKKKTWNWKRNILSWIFKRRNREINTIDSTITIFYYMKENKDYIINEKGEINPVDYLNTGIVQRNMHQMLQI